MRISGTKTNSVILCEYSVNLCVTKNNYTESLGEDTEIHRVNSTLISHI